MTLLVLTLPIVLVIAVGSASTLRAWPFFTQYRVGRGGQLFRFVKVRTLPVQTPPYIDKHHLDTEHLPAFCALIRRLHLDELPQLFHVVGGRMAMVGPRPEMACLHEQMAPAFAEARTRVRPGATGLWQLSESCTGLIAAGSEYDLHYLARRSLRFDLWILARTSLQMLGLRRCLTLADVPEWVAPAPDATVVALPEPRPAEPPDLTLPAAASR